MNMRAENFHAGASTVATPLASFRITAGHRRRVQATVVAVSDAVSAVLVNEPNRSDAAAPKRRLEATLDGAALGRPLIATHLDLVDGGVRHVLLLGHRAADLAARRMTITLDDVPAAELDPEWLQSPIADSTALLDRLTHSGRRRLLRLLVTTGASLFGLSLGAGYGPLTRQLMALQGGSQHGLASICALGAAGQILTWRLPEGQDTPDPRDLVLECAERTIAGRVPQLHLEETASGRLLHLFTPRALPEAAQFLALSDRPMLLEGPRGDGPLPQPLVPWLARRGAAAQAWARGLLEDEAPRCPIAAALLSELDARTEQLPALALLHLSVTRTGLLYAFDLTDTLDLVRAVRLEIGAEAREIPAGLDPLVGYLPWPGRSHEICRIRLVYHSGRIQTAHEGPMDGFDGTVPAAFARLDPDMAARSLARARFDGTPPLTRGRVEVEQFGARPARLRVSVVVRASSNTDLLRARAAAIFAQKRGRETELVVFAPDGPGRDRIRRCHAEIAATFGLPIRSLTLRGRWTAAEALRAGLAEAAGETSLILGANVLPQGPQWLDDWHRALRSGKKPVIVGGTLLSASGSVLHAGGRRDRSGLGVDQPALGLPASDLPGTASAATCIASSECVGLGEKAKALLLSSPSLHPNPDIVLADVIRRLVGAGGSARLSFRNRCVRFGAPADLDALSIAADAIAVGHVVAGEAQAVRADGFEGC